MYVRKNNTTKQEETTMTNLKEICINEGIELTELPDHAIYILPDGSLIDGCFYDNERSEDHRLAESLSEFDRYDGNRFWLDLFNNLNMIMLVPETKTILITKQQTITPEQTDQMNMLIDNYYYTIELFQ
jgi:hypothetical protein